MYHLQAILHLTIDHQPDHWYQPKKGRELKMDTGETSALTPAQQDIRPFKATLSFLFFKKSDIILSSLLNMAFCFSLKIMPIKQTLSAAFEISSNTPLTSNSSSKDLFFVVYR